jgi:hypothetical protein
MDEINHPAHYNAHPSGIECIDVAQHCQFSLGNALKYIWRFEHKNKDQGPDLLKAKWYLRNVIETGQARVPPHKARLLLQTVIDGETNLVRAEMLRLLTEGRIQECIQLIDATFWADPIKERK